MSLKRKNIRILIIIIISFLLGLGSAQAYSLSVYGGFNSNPVYLDGNSNLTSSMYSSIHNGCLPWNSAGAKINVYRSSKRPAAVSFPSKNGKNQVSHSKVGVNDYLMCTYRYNNASGLKTIESDININTSVPWGSAASTSGVFDYQSAMTHEIGHVLGLGHSNAINATMYSTMPKNETSKRTLDSDDKYGARAIYGIR